eukprot:5677482-Pleurochrysis_carterae.AAC.2
MQRRCVACGFALSLVGNACNKCTAFAPRRRMRPILRIQHATWLTSVDRFIDCSSVDATHEKSSAWRSESEQLLTL